MRKKVLLGIALCAVVLFSTGLAKESLPIKQPLSPSSSAHVIQQIANLAPEGKILHSPIQLLFTQEQVRQQEGLPKGTFDHLWVYPNLLLGFDYKVNLVFSIASSTPEVASLTLTAVKNAFAADPNYKLYSENSFQDNRYVVEYKHLNRTRVRFTFPNPTAAKPNPKATSYAVVSGETY